ncbi:MAG: bifunctional serine/threonine-protein kinase/formylglycine-generating enzyme family protein [Thermomonas sp.]
MSANAHPEVDGYRITRVIGQGGMSIVYLAEQVSLDRKVALKVMLAEALADEVSRARFENEARTIARLQHPNIVGIHEVGRTAEGLPFYSMPFLPRGHLAQRKLQGDQPRVIAIIRALLQALDYAHVRGVVHRDVKAENVLFDEVERPMLADFGIALRRGSNPRLTNAGLAVGSTAYMPPEQARGTEVDRRADLYSIGVLTWEMLTGRLPYNAADALSMALKHVQDPIPRLPAVLKHWQGFIDRSMAKRAEDRYTSAQDMLLALDQLEARAGKAFVAVEVPAISEATLPAKQGMRWKPWALAAAALAIVAIATARFYPIESDVIRAAGPDSATNGVAGGGLPSPQADARTGLMTGMGEGEGNTEGLAAYLANAGQQMRDGQLLSPANANAWDSLDAAWRVNATHPQTQQLTAQLFDALAEASDRALRAGDIALSRTAFERARQLDSRRGGEGSAIALLRKRLDAALDTRLQALLAKRDATAARQLLTDTRWLDLDPLRTRALLARVDVAGKSAPPAAAAATVVNATPATPPAPVVTITVSRADYARFANGTGRTPAECGKGVFGRKRSWNNTGNDRRPVVCVSAADAQAYAAWLGAQDQRRYRLPSAGEVRAQPTTPVSGWLTLCANRQCSERMASGKPRALDANRGFEDVGIRLVRAD